MTTEIVNAFTHIYICILQDWTWRRDLGGRRGRDARGKAVHFDNIIYIYIYIFICKLDWNRYLRKRCKRDQAVHFPTIKANLIFCLLYSQNNLLSKWFALKMISERSNFFATHFDPLHQITSTFHFTFSDSVSFNLCLFLLFFPRIFTSPSTVIYDQDQDISPRETHQMSLPPMK